MAIARIHEEVGLAKRPTVLPTMTVTFPDGPLAGHEFVMHEPPSSLVFGTEDTLERELVGPALAAVVDHTLDIGDIGDIPPTWGLALSARWLQVWREAVLPPATGRRSPRRSPSQP